MLITAREKAIIELLIKKNGYHSVTSLATFLNVSTRTIQRDLKGVARILDQFELSVVNEDGLTVKGANKNIYRLIQKLMESTPSDFSIKERRLLAYIQLFDAQEPLKLSPLARELGISVTTLSSDFDEWEEWLANYDVILERKKGVGVELVGREEAKRKAFISYLLLYFEDELIDYLFMLSNNQFQTDKVLFYFEKEYLQTIDQIVYDSLNQIDLKLVDRDYITFLIQVCLSLQRTKQGFKLSDQIQMMDTIKKTTEYSMLKRIQEVLGDLFSIWLSEKEIAYLVTLLRGSKQTITEHMYEDRVFLNRSIKTLIQAVSEQLHVDLTRDFSLFQGLLAHLEPTIYRKHKGLPIFNPLTEEIKKKYPLLFMAVKKSLSKAFQRISFSEDETAYLVMHFGSALELKKEKVQICALIICPTGIGTSKMLSSRIKSEIPEITSTVVVSIKDIHQIDLKQYPLIISTVLIPMQAGIEYIYVNPLLYERDIQAIRDYLSDHVHEITKQNLYKREVLGSDSEQIEDKYESLYAFMDDLDLCQQTIRTLLRNFSVKHMKNEPTYDDVVRKILTLEVEQGTITNAEEVFKQLKIREAKGGFGIPGTNMALFHCRHQSIKEMSFRIVHLPSAYRLIGMDMKEMNARNILLLLAPEQLHGLQLEILSIVSTILVENKETIMIFSSANEHVIREKLETAFLHFLQNKFRKE